LPRDRTYDDEAMKAALFTEDPLYRSVFADGVAHGFDPASNLRDMDREGVDVAVLFPTLGLYIIWDDEIEPGISAAICRAYNNWLAEYCSHDRARLKGVALIPLHDTRLAVEELRRAKNELGLSGIFWRPNRLKGRTFGHPDYFADLEVASGWRCRFACTKGREPLWLRLGRTLQPLRTTRCLPPAGADAGCFDLRGGRGAGAIPRAKKSPSSKRDAAGFYWLERMDEHWKHYTLGRSAPRKSCRALEASMCRQLRSRRGTDRLLVEHVGDDYLIMATDYPHADAAEKFPEHTVGDLANNSFVKKRRGEEDPVGNPARFMGSSRFVLRGEFSRGISL
jgi:hypothetical protein